jgi:hypothetical protein
MEKETPVFAVADESVDGLKAKVLELLKKQEALESEKLRLQSQVQTTDKGSFTIVNKTLLDKILALNKTIATLQASNLSLESQLDAERAKVAQLEALLSKLPAPSPNSPSKPLIFDAGAKQVPIVMSEAEQIFAQIKKQASDELAKFAEAQINTEHESKELKSEHYYDMDNEHSMDAAQLRTAWQVTETLLAQQQARSAAVAKLFEDRLREVITDRDRIQKLLLAAEEEIALSKGKKQRTQVVFQASAILSSLTATAGLRVGKDFYSASRLPRGCIVTAVVEGGTAYNAGIRPGHTVLKLNHVATHTSVDLLLAFKNVYPGDRVPAEVLTTNYYYYHNN